MPFLETPEHLEQYGLSPDFRRQLKARVMPHEIPVQIVLESTLDVTDQVRNGEKGTNPLSDRLWNLGTALFYKCGQKPWKTPWAREGDCYVGLAYRRDERGARRRGGDGPAGPTAPERAAMSGGKPPVYARVLRLRHIHPGGLLCFAFFEGSATSLAFKNTLILCTLAATIGTVLALVISYITTRKSIAGYAYELIGEDSGIKARTTSWAPEEGSVVKKTLARHWTGLAAAKNKLTGN